MQIKRAVIAAFALALSAAVPGAAQSLEDLNIQIHGYATQGFLYTTKNNIFTTTSSNGSPAWTEAVINISSQPIPKLRITAQGRYFLLGSYGNAITLDYAAADYKASDRFGVRFGKVKTPSGLYNEFQDIDPSYLWSLLPQSVYAIGSRNSQLAEYGGVIYGTLNGPKTLGKLEYRGWAGVRIMGPDDGQFLSQKEAGTAFPNGLVKNTAGGALHWLTPLPGLMLGASNDRQMESHSKETISSGAVTGSQTIYSLNKTFLFGRYEKGRFMFAAEHFRYPIHGLSVIGTTPPSVLRVNYQSWYAMASYKATEKLTVGLYDSQQFNRLAKLGPARYSKDFVVSGRYDFSQFLYAKAEQHFIQGTSLNYDTDANPGGLQPNTKLTVFKVGVSF